VNAWPVPRGTTRGDVPTAGPDLDRRAEHRLGVLMPGGKRDRIVSPNVKGSVELRAGQLVVHEEIIPRHGTSGRKV